jgi:hypothetical protein
MELVIQSLPSDLDQLFYQLLCLDQSKGQLKESSHTLELVRAREIVIGFVKDESRNSLSLWKFAFAVDEGG